MLGSYKKKWVVKEDPLVTLGTLQALINSEKDMQSLYQAARGSCKGFQVLRLIVSVLGHASGRVAP